MVHRRNKKVHWRLGEEGAITKVEKSGFIETLIFCQESPSSDKEKMIVVAILEINISFTYLSFDFLQFFPYTPQKDLEVGFFLV